MTHSSLSTVCCTLATFVFAIGVGSAQAQGGPTVTLPGGSVYAAGPDYATDVLHDPWDFSNVEDVSQHPDDYRGWEEWDNARLVGASAFGVGPVSGRFTATSNSTDPGIGLLYSGGVGVPNPGRSGLRYPIATATYRKLAFRLKASGPATSRPAVHWFLGGKPSASGAAASSVAATPGDRIYTIDLIDDFAAGGNPALSRPYDSQATMAGLRLDPTSDNGVTVELDWVRLTAADTGADAAMMSVQVDGCPGTSSLAVIDSTGLSTVVDGAVPDGPATVAFNYGIFPPGAYELELTCSTGAPSPRVPFTIDAPPHVTVLQPDALGGAEYGAVVRHNPWDMQDAADVPLWGNLDQIALTPAPGQPAGSTMVRGRNIASPNANVQGDPNLFLLYGEGASRPIASARYRYLTFTAQLHHAFDLGEGAGSMARVLWGSATHWDGHVVTTSDDILMWPGRNTYTIDLGALAPGDGLEPCPPSSTCSWTAKSPRFLRFDPHEFSKTQVQFDLDDVTLAAPDEVTQGETFSITWSVADAASGKVNLYYDDDTNFANGHHTIATNRPLTPGVFNWPVGALPPGDYYIYVEVTEAAPAQTRGAYSTGVLRVVSAVNTPVVSIASPAAGAVAYAPFDVAGCAYNSATGAAADDVIVYAHPLEGQLGGVVQVLGYNAPGGLGTISAAPCASGPGYRVSGVILPPGRWTFRTLARNTITGDFDEVQVQNLTVSLTAAPARNLRIVSVSGNTVTVAWDPPATGSPVTQYRIEAAGNPSFAGFTPIVFPPSVTSVSGTLLDGTYYVRVVTGNNYTGEGPASNVIAFTLPGGAVPGPPTPPGAPTLTGTQVAMNPVTLSWSPGAGGAPTQYYVLAGTVSNGADYGTFPMGLETAVSAIAPAGRTYVRVLAMNAGGQAISNEISFVIAPPPAPVMQPADISGRDVTLRWSASPAAESYVVIARDAAASTVLVTLPVDVPALHVPGAPSGTYSVSVVAVNGTGWSAESNAVIVRVP